MSASTSHDDLRLDELQDAAQLGLQSVAGQEVKTQMPESGNNWPRLPARMGRQRLCDLPLATAAVSSSQSQTGRSTPSPGFCHRRAAERTANFGQRSEPPDRLRWSRKLPLTRFCARGVSEAAGKSWPKASKGWR